MSNFVINPNNTKVAEWTDQGLFVEQDKVIQIGTSRIRDAGESLVLFDRTVGGISLEEIAKVAQGNSTGEWNPSLMVNDKPANIEISENVYSKIGNICFVNASIKYLGNSIEMPKILVTGLPFISSHNAQIAGQNGFIVKGTENIEIKSVEYINNGTTLTFSATYII